MAFIDETVNDALVFGLFSLLFTVNRRFLLLAFSNMRHSLNNLWLLYLIPLKNKKFVLGQKGVVIITNDGELISRVFKRLLVG